MSLSKTVLWAGGAEYSPSLGVPAKALTNRHGPCPVCGGKDRFRFDDKGGRGTWICSTCGAGDGIELVKRLLSRFQGGGQADRAADRRGAGRVVATISTELTRRQRQEID